jgi:HPt (histidine-containing phosphotransfer) domain-containing protein
MIDIQTLRELTDNIGKSSVTRILKVFLDEMEDQLAEIKLCLESYQIREIAGVAHTLKSTSATFGAIELRDIAFQIEMAARNDNLDELLKLSEPLTICIASMRTLYRPYTG